MRITEIGKLIPVLVVPIILLLFVVVYANMDNVMTQSSTFETSTTNDTLTVVNGTAVSLDRGTLLSFTRLYNASDNTDVIPTTNYTVDLTAGTVTLVDNVTGFNNTLVGADYVYYGGDAYTTLTKVNTQAYSAFNLASILPIVLIGVAVISIILGAFALRGRD